MFYLEKKLRLFAELEEYEQRKVIEKELPKHKDYCFDDDYRNYDEMWIEKLENLGFNNVEIMYSGFYKQGDGLCFVGNISREDFNEFLKKIGYVLEPDLKKCLETDLEFYLTLTHSGHYFHESSITLDLSYNNYSVSDESDKIVEKYFDAIEDYIDTWRERLCCQWYATLETQYESYDDETSVTEYLLKNHLFDEELNKYDYDSTDFYETSRVDLESQLKKVNERK